MENSLLFGPIEKIEESLFYNIYETMVFRAAKFTNGSAGPSQTDAEFFRFILTHKNFKEEGKKLRNEIAKFARLIASKPFNPDLLDSYVNSRLIPLNKCPGVRPIGIGETFRRIVGKCLSWELKTAIQVAAGPLQVCTGLKSGSEAAVHYMREQFETESAEAVILVDASNAFNSVNRQALLHNVRVLCPELSIIAINMYRKPCRLFVGGTEIPSREGTTQGDNLAMSLFAIATLPVLRKLEDHEKVAQVWLADDATGVGTLHALLGWWKDIIVEGLKYGYFVNQEKSCLILKNPEHLHSAQEIFSDCNIDIRIDGQRHLGAVLGTPEFKDTYINNLVVEWSDMLKKLVHFAKSQPQAAYACFTHGVRHKFTYFMRTLDISSYMGPLDKIITHELIPTIFGCPISPIHRELMSLPLKNGGMGMPQLEYLAKREHAASLLVTRGLVNSMKGKSLATTFSESTDELQDILKQRVSEYKEQQENIFKKVDKKTARVLDQISEPGSSNWLSCLPLRKHGFVLNKSEFRDSIRLRYNLDLDRLPSQCPCGKTFDVNHSLNCHLGGYIIIRHNEIRDFLAGLLKTVCSDVEVEPQLQELEGEQFTRSSTLTGDQARPDIKARGFYRAGQVAFFDVKVINPNSNSYLQHSTKKVMENAEKCYPLKELCKRAVRADTAHLERIIRAWCST